MLSLSLAFMIQSLDSVSVPRRFVRKSDCAANPSSFAIAAMVSRIARRSVTFPTSEVACVIGMKFDSAAPMFPAIASAEYLFWNQFAREYIVRPKSCSVPLSRSDFLFASRFVYSVRLDAYADNCVRMLLPFSFVYSAPI